MLATAEINRTLVRTLSAHGNQLTFEDTHMTTSPTWQDVALPGNAADFFRRTNKPFDPSTESFVPGNARWLMELSRLSYRHDIEETPNPPRPTRKEFLEQAGLRQIRFFQFKAEDIDTQAMLVTSAHPNYAALVFRGTEPLGDELLTPDLMTDIKFWKSSIKNSMKKLKKAEHLANPDEILVHQGFKEALDGVWRDIETELARLDCPVYYTGHSLGAALAILAAARPLPAGCKLNAVYTFAAPRVGNHAFADSLPQVPIYRVVNGNDIVTQLPPEGLGFTHVGQEHTLDSPGSFLSWLTPRRWFLFKPLADHAPICYVNHIK